MGGATVPSMPVFHGKKVALALIVLFLGVAALGCAKAEQGSNGQSFFTARVEEIYSSHLLVEVTDPAKAA